MAASGLAPHAHSSDHLWVGHFVYADKGEETLQPALSGACVNDGAVFVLQRK